MTETIKADKAIEAPRIPKVRPGKGDYVLRVSWANGTSSNVDLTEPIFRLKLFRPLRDPERFRQARIADWGCALHWDDELDFSHERVWELAKEQSNAELTPSEFRKWLKKRRLTQEKAARLLGVSKRTIAYYSTGAQPVTRLVALALKGADAEGKGASH